MLFTIDAIEFDVTIFEVIPAFKRFFFFCEYSPTRAGGDHASIGVLPILGRGCIIRKQRIAAGGDG